MDGGLNGVKISQQQSRTIARAIASDIKKYVDEHPDEYKAFKNSRVLRGLDKDTPT